MAGNSIKTILEDVRRADVYLVRDSPYLHRADVAETTGDPDNAVLRFTWRDKRAQAHQVKFTENALAVALLGDNRITVTDHKGDETVIELFSLTPLNVSRRQDIELLLRLAQDCGVTEEVLDDVIHEVASEIASSANNEGLRGQIAWLVDKVGARDARGRVLAAGKQGCSAMPPRGDHARTD